MGALVNLNSIAESIIDDVDWSKFEIATGPAVAAGAALRALLLSSNVQEASDAWGGIEEFIFSQGTIFSAAEPTVSVMLAALAEDQPPWRSGRILDLLFYIVTASSLTDPSLPGRCRDRAREGIWLLAHWAHRHDGWARDNALEVIEAVAPDRGHMIRKAVTRS